MSDDPPMSDGLAALRNAALLGYTAPKLTRIGQVAADRYSPGLDPLRSAAMMAVPALIREAYDKAGPAFARSIAALISEEVRAELDYVRRWERNDREQATGSKALKRRTPQGGAE